VLPRANIIAVIVVVLRLRADVDYARARGERYKSVDVAVAFSYDMQIIANYFTRACANARGADFSRV
jgi:hypothetical protein